MPNRKKSMAELQRLSPGEFKQTAKLPVCLVLDDIRSANNVGSVFRTADGFALQHVYLCGITATPPHRDILKTALGATESVSWSHHESCVELVAQLRAEGYQVQALEQTLSSIRLRDFEPEVGQPLAVVIGNEVKGVQQAVIDQCHGTIEIEQFGTKHSLNVAVATGMVVFALSRVLRTG
ncbi:MAG: RNA methyltransferase [Bacteroidota bacterium]